ncbi:MAG: MerR family transcriptional regulator [Alphaproteobacteria bacterium]
MSKGPDAFRTISEASEELGVAQHVLRFWESKFSFIRPMKRAGGRRFYRPQDIAILKGVRRLLHDEGYTIKGVQRLHREEGLKRLLGEDPFPRITVPAEMPALPVASPAKTQASSQAQGALLDALADLETAKARLDRLLG